MKAAKAPTPRTLDCGGYVIVLRCPNCQNPAEVLATISTRLTVETDGGTLRASFHAVGVDHRCGQLSTLDVGDPDADDVGTPTFDFAQRAAGEHLDRD